MVDELKKGIDISFVGSGNVASHLARSFCSAGYDIKEIFGRNIDSVTELACEVGAVGKLIEDGLFIDSKLIVIAVPDDFIREVSVKIVAGNDSVTVHTSGSTGIDVFNGVFDRFGVLYPLQTFSKSMSVDMKKVPFFIEASDVVGLDFIMEVVSSVSCGNVFVSDSLKRKEIHLVAVFVSNFVNLLYGMGYDLLKDEKIGFDILKPLIKMTADKVLVSKDPFDVQTGPAVRGDFMTIDKHLDMLKALPEYKAVYELLTSVILNKKIKN